MKFAIETLGCKVNFYESEVMINKLISNNFVRVKMEDNPDIIIINTCSVTNNADSKDRKLIRKYKRMNPKAICVVCGCLSQHNQSIQDELGIDILIGNYDKSKIVDLINEYLDKKNKITRIYDLNNVSFEDMMITSNYERTRAFVKIEDGCDNYCTYCLIPYVRGRVRFKDFNLAVNEIKNLVNNGFKEIVLTGIHTGRYPKLVELIREISKFDGLERIRISSIEITEINNDEFLNELINNPKLCNHMHIPVQSAADNTLKRMNRKYNINEFKDIITKIRNARPDINITTDLIVGFPTETNEDFEESIKNAEELDFGKIHVFPYSKRDGTAAAVMKNIVSDIDKKERTTRMLALSSKLERVYYEKFIGRVVSVLIEEVIDGKSYGYTENYLRVCINEILEHNTFINVKIINIDNNIAVGKICN